VNIYSIGMGASRIRDGKTAGWGARNSRSCARRRLGFMANRCSPGPWASSSQRALCVFSVVVFNLGPQVRSLRRCVLARKRQSSSVSPRRGTHPAGKSGCCIGGAEHRTAAGSLLFIGPVGHHGGRWIDPSGVFTAQLWFWVMFGGRGVVVGGWVTGLGLVFRYRIPLWKGGWVIGGRVWRHFKRKSKLKQRI